MQILISNTLLFCHSKGNPSCIWLGQGCEHKYVYLIITINMGQRVVYNIRVGIEGSPDIYHPYVMELEVNSRCARD